VYLEKLFLQSILWLVGFMKMESPPTSIFMKLKRPFIIFFPHGISQEDNNNNNNNKSHAQILHHVKGSQLRVALF